MQQQPNMNPNVNRGMHPNSNVSQLQQRLTQQRMSVGVVNSGPAMQPRPGMLPGVNRMPLQHGGAGPGMPMVRGSAAPMYSISSSPQMVQVNSPAMMMAGQSPMGGHFVPSPQQSNVLSPGGQRMGMAPSPQSTSIRTPQNAELSQQPEDQAYLEKVRQLSKYIDPLRKMIAKIGNEDQDKLGKMKKLLDILSNPSKRLAYDVLLRCESVLEHMIREVPAEEETSSINPLLDAIIKLKNHRMASSNQVLNHTLHRTFGPPLEAIGGAEITLPPPVKRRKRCADVGKEVNSASECELPDYIQGEVAHLHSRFKVSLDPSQAPILPYDSIHLFCHLEDRDLPAVPPISVTLAPNYPDESSPELNDNKDEYEASPFLSNVRQALLSRTRKMANRYSLTQLLTAWEMAVRSACSYKSKPDAGSLAFSLVAT